MKSNLNLKQQEAAEYINGPLLILAGAGAGKTKTIVERVIEIVRSGVDPANILCVTFTNKAAAEMRERILHRLKEEKMIEDFVDTSNGFNSFRSAQFLPTIKTFHSLGLFILKREHEAAGLLKNFVILDSDDSRAVVKDYLNSIDVDTKIYEPSKIRNAISREKGDFKNVRELREKVANYSMEITCNAWEHYENKLREMGAVDFDDLIIRVVHLLKNNPDIKKKYQNFFKYIHVDEYQDTNNSQYELTSLLVNPETKNICVVGDTDQNIYSWRGANLKNIMNFENDYKSYVGQDKNSKQNENKVVGAKIVLLEENYRSTQNILTLANTSIKKNTIRKDKNLFTVQGDGEKIIVLPTFDGDSEAECVALKCAELIAEKNVDPSDIAILYRTNFQSRVLEEKMLTHDVPYTVLGVRFFERKEVRDIMSYLKVTLNPSSQPDLKRVFETPKRGIGKATIAKVFAGEILTGAAATKVRAVYEFLAKIKEQISYENSEIHEVLTYILVESGIEAELKDDGDDGMLRLANISELITLAENFTRERVGGDFDACIEKLMEITSLSSDQDDDKKESVGVRLMTVHASKGLEFEYVFIVGLEEDLFPAKNFSGKKRSKEEEEEERRLFYVAVTRARKKLYLSYAEMRTIFGQRNIAAPSQFLSDLDGDIYEWEDIYYKQHSGYGVGKVVYI